MGERTGIAWTDHTFNPWWGCARVSPGCTACYAEALARRFGHSEGGSRLPLWGVDAARKPASEASWKDLAKWNYDAGRIGVRKRVFVASMADVFEVAPERNAEANRVMQEGRRRLWHAIASCHHLDFQLLTKRPENILELAPQEWRAGVGWPRNVWLGTTVEDQERAETRIPELLQVPARVRFLSCEPLLSSVELTKVWLLLLDWIIVGGESGPKSRPFDLEWARKIVSACAPLKVPVFVKQFGSNPVNSGSRIRLADRSGAEPSEWAADLRVQQFPAEALAKVPR